MKKIILISFFFFLSFCSAFAQSINLKFENLDTSEGLSSSTTTEIFQDEEGFLWFGTIDGLNKYDGYEFKIYRPELNNLFSISNNRITSIVEDNQGNLWVGTNNGLNLFDKKTERFYRIPFYSTPDHTQNSSEAINDLFYDKKADNLWVGTKNGLIKFKTDDLQKENLTAIDFTHYRHNESDFNSIDNNNVTSIVKDRENNIWIGTDGSNLNKYNSKKDHFERLPIAVDETFELNQLPKQVLFDHDNNLWIGNNLSNLVYWESDINNFKELSLVDYDIAIFDLYQDSNGVIWIGTDGHGLFLYNKEDGIFQHLEHYPEDPFSLSNNQPSKIFEDEEGIIWIGTYNKGVSKQAPAKASFGHYFFQYGNEAGLSTKIAQSVLEDSAGRIWIGTDGGGLNLFNEDKGTFTHYRAEANNPSSISSDKILYLVESFDGKIWICTWDGGLSKFDPISETAINYQYDSENDFSISQNTIWTAVEDSKKRLWIGTQAEGLNLFDPNTENFYQFDNASSNLNSDFIFSLFIDSGNRLFIGTSGGLNYVELDSLDDYIPSEIKFKEVPHDNIRGNRINYITEDESKNIWVGTDIGLYKLNANFDLLVTYSYKDGLPNNLIVGIVEDNNNQIWITTKSGLSLLNPEEHTFKNFNVHDGLQGTEFQSKSIEKTSEGRIIVGGINGFNIFNPNDIDLSSKGIEPIITNFKLFNNNVRVGDTINDRILLQKPISEIDKIELKHDETYLAFDFVALNFQNPERVNYSYRMKGLDDNFINAGINRTANYSNLPPGSYTFEVRASIDEEWEEAKTSRVNLEVLSPPWATWWAYLLYFIFFTGLLITLFWLYTKKLREDKEHELDQSKLKFFMNVSHEFRTPLTLILNPVNKILSSYNNPAEVQKSALVIQRSARRLLYLINQLLDFRKMDIGMASLKVSKADIVAFSKNICDLFQDLVRSKYINFEFESSEDQIEMYFDIDKYEKIITNLMSNALKFTEHGGSIKFFISKGNLENKKMKLKGDGVEIKVIDTGIGFKKDQLDKVFSRFFNADNTNTGTGIGLNFTKALVELHGGSIQVKSEHGKGTEFIIYLPIKPPSTSFENIEEKDIDELLRNSTTLNTIKAAEYEIAISETSSDSEEVINEGKEKPVLLIVEDNRELRTHLKNELQKNFNIKEAKNGKVAYDRVKKIMPDIVISDVMMPEMDGFEFCNLVKSDIDTCHIPIILLTARTLEEDRIEGFETGADEYLPKPFNIYVLRARIKNLLEARKRLREKFTAISGVAASSKVAGNSQDEAFLDKTTMVIMENIEDENFKLDDLIQELGIGRSQFYRKINSITGQNPSNFIRTIKLKYAAELLLKDEFSIKEVSHMTGFNSSAYFTKTFKELYNLTPTQFVKKEKADLD